MASSVREKVVEQIRAAKRAMRDAEKVVKTKLVRARDDKGHYVKDDPTTEVNEAWVEVPVEENKPVKKAAAKKKAPAKKPAAKKSAKQLIEENNHGRCSNSGHEDHNSTGRDS